MSSEQGGARISVRICKHGRDERLPGIASGDDGAPLVPLFRRTAAQGLVMKWADLGRIQPPAEEGEVGAAGPPRPTLWPPDGTAMNTPCS